MFEIHSVVVSNSLQVTYVPGFVLDLDLYKRHILKTNILLSEKTGGDNRQTLFKYTVITGELYSRTCENFFLGSRIWFYIYQGGFFRNGSTGDQ